MFIPNQVIEIRPHDLPWYTSKLCNLNRIKDRLHQTSKSTKRAIDWEKFRSARNHYPKKSNTHRNLNPKNWWHITKQFMGKIKGNIIPRDYSIM